jgi:hypothetical protein
MTDPTRLLEAARRAALELMDERDESRLDRLVGDSLMLVVHVSEPPASCHLFVDGHEVSRDLLDQPLAAEVASFCEAGFIRLPPGTRERALLQGGIRVAVDLDEACAIAYVKADGAPPLALFTAVLGRGEGPGSAARWPRAGGALAS